MQNKTKLLAVCIIILLIFIGGGEIYLRNKLGLANAPLYMESDKYEYIVKPNQDGVRFGKHFHYNSFCQRSEEPDTTKSIILGLGDSVLFGGAVIDQDSIATSLFTAETDMQMLNISAGSWGPDNCSAYLDQYGMFGAKAMFLLVSSHDAHDNMTFESVVGKHPSYPDKNYWCAWAELLDRYAYPRTIGKLLKKESDGDDPDAKVLKSIDGTDIDKKAESFNPGFDSLKQKAVEYGISLLVCLHPDRKELEAGEYNDQGQEIIQWCKDNGITIILELDEGITSEMFRDGIHINEKGMRFEANIMKKYLKDII